ncbi:MAG: hypothetical protein ACD_12C00649G0001, partial [uncultured bacterium]
MAKTRSQKEKIVKNLSEKIKNAKTVIFSNSQGVKVKDIQELRKQLREQDIHYETIKKSLLKISLEEAGYKDIDLSQYNSTIAVTLGEDEVMPAKFLGK